MKTEKEKTKFHHYRWIALFLDICRIITSSLPSYTSRM